MNNFSFVLEYINLGDITKLFNNLLKRCLEALKNSERDAKNKNFIRLKQPKEYGKPVEKDHDDFVYSNILKEYLKNAQTSKKGQRPLAN
ncbi:hypothetical protein [Salipaludibacillus sp. CF4.18]|uniref:hypothetical protein n=1 Tax=Salipaludibacillus sp. CF4.18 TaxID=3373081 RepID=UPI003EE63E6A